MEKLCTSKTFLKMAGGSRAVDLGGPSVYQGEPKFEIKHWPLAPLGAGPGWEDAYPSSYPLAISYRSHQKSLAYFSHLVPLILFFFTKRQSQKEGGAWQNVPLNYALVFTFRPIKVLMVDFRKKGLDKKVFVVHGEAPYFSEALSFSLPSLLVNPAMVTAQENKCRSSFL